MRILEVISGRAVNGAVLHCLMLTQELVRRGNQVTLVCRPGAWIAEQLAAEPVDIVYSDLSRWPLDELRRIGALAAEQRIDVIHTHMSRAHFFGVLLRVFTKVPCVATAHARLLQLHWMFNDLVIAVSEATRRYQQRINRVRSDRITTIHNFIDQQRIQAVKDDARARIRQSLGVDDRTTLIGTIGTIYPKKGQVYMVRALPRILEAIPNARLAFIGEETEAYAQKLRRIARRLGVDSKILWTGHRDDVPEVMAALDLCAVPSLEESLGMVAIEAMAAGLPVVATTVGGVPECVLPDETGILVPPADSRALAEAIVSLLGDPARCLRFGEAGRRRVDQQFSREGQVTRIEAAFGRAIDLKRAA